MRSNVADFLQVCDMFVLPSGSEESFGNSAVEAMGLGVPTIVMADGGGLVEHVKHEKTGMVAHGAGDLASWITRLASDGELRRSLGARGSASVRETYSIERMVAGYSDLYAGRPALRSTQVT
jgi:glycosyltransferase involved in cell wall biosynthesis